MTVPLLVHTGLLYGSIALAVGAVAVFFVRDGRPKLPAATVHGGPSRAMRRWIARIAPWIALAIGVVGAIWLDTQCHELVIVTDDGAALHARHVVQLGGGVPEESVDPHDVVWVENRSSHVVRVEGVQYGGPSFGHTAAEVRPGATRGFPSIDYIGPDDPPPDKIEVRSPAVMESRNWLTWD